MKRKQGAEQLEQNSQWKCFWNRLERNSLELSLFSSIFAVVVFVCALHQFPYALFYVSIVCFVEQNIYAGCMLSVCIFVNHLLINYVRAFTWSTNLFEDLLFHSVISN